MHHSHYKYKQMLWGKTTRRKNARSSARQRYSSYEAGVFPEGGLEVGLVIFFRSPLHANQFILARNEDTICILKSNTGQENFRTVARHNKCSFLQVRKESGSPV